MGAASKGFRISTILLVTACITAVLLAGCVSPPSGGGGKPPAPDMLVEYRRTGGIAGFDDHLVIFSNGQAIYARRDGSGIFNLTRDELSALTNLLEAADFPALAPNYPAPSPGADYFSYAITYQGKTVTTETGGVPPALAPVIGQLDYLLAEYS
jgi:hypothetical protein